MAEAVSSPRRKAFQHLDDIMLPQPDLFWSHVDKAGECWLWTARIGTTGYGAVSVLRNGFHRTFKAHRVAWELENGPIPEGKFLCHHCDNPPCVNPTHMFIGSHNDNMADAKAKGRMRWANTHARRIDPSLTVRGERHGQARLTLNDVEEIKRRYAGGELQRVIASDYGVRQTQVSRIVRGERWANQGVPALG